MRHHVVRHQAELRTCIDACFACAESCEVFARECIELGDLEGLSGAIAVARECALICKANAELMTLGGANSMLICDCCAALCNNCADEIEHLQLPVQARRCVNDARICADECLHLSHAIHDAND